MSNEPVFLVKEENRDFLQGEREKPVLEEQSVRWVLPLFAAIFTLAAIGLVIGAVVSWRNYTALVDNGVMTTGQYSDKRAQVDADNNSSTYHVEYTFVVNDQTYESEARVSEEVYDSTTVGAPVEVLYLPSDPRVSQVAALRTPPWLLTIIAALGVPFAGVVIAGAFVYNTHAQKLLKQGTVIRGEVERAEEHRDSEKDRWLYIDYVFQKPGTQDDMLTGKHKLMTEARTPPARGTEVAIFYADEDTYRLL